MTSPRHHEQGFLKSNGEQSITWEIKPFGSFVIVDHKWQAQKLFDVASADGTFGRVEYYQDPRTKKYIVTQYFKVIHLVETIDILTNEPKAAQSSVRYGGLE